MPGTDLLVLIVVGVVFSVCGAISAVAPRTAALWDRRLYRTLRLVSEETLKAPVKRRQIIFERVQGGLFLALGILLIAHFGVLRSLLTDSYLSLSNAADRHVTDFRSAVRDLAVSEGLAPGAPAAARPDELRIISAKYGARDTWIDVTEQVRERIHSNTLDIKASNALAGDPLFGVPKTLTVEYLLDGEQKTAALREGATLRIPPDPLDELSVITTAERLSALARACPAEVGFYGRNFTTGKTVEYRSDQPACLASIVKIFVLLEVMCRVEEGSLNLLTPVTIERGKGTETCTVSEALDRMIGVSDNEATSALARLVGYDEVNALPAQLGITGLSEEILPRPGVLDDVLDKRVYGLRVLEESDLLPQHGTARAIVRYFGLLQKNELVNEKVSQRVLEVFDRNPKCFAPRATPLNFSSGGKGGGIGWVRPFRPAYNMGGWGILIRSEEVALGFCLWCEWFPASMSQEEQWQWCSGLSDCIVNILLLPASGNEQEENVSHP